MTMIAAGSAVSRHSFWYMILGFNLSWTIPSDLIVEIPSDIIALVNSPASLIFYAVLVEAFIILPFVGII